MNLFSRIVLTMVLAVLSSHYAVAYHNISPYAWCGGNPIVFVDPVGKNGVKIVDNENKTITVFAVYYVVTGDAIYKDTNKEVKTQAGYTSENINEMTKYNEYLNGLGLNVSEGDYKGYRIKFDLRFKDGRDIAKSNGLASEEMIDGHPIGNTIRLGNADQYKHLKFETIYNPDGTTSTVGGVTSDKRDIVMNVVYDNFEYRLHEIFHTLGFSHPKGVGGKEGIMHYPPQTPSQNDADEIAKSKFLQTPN